MSKQRKQEKKRQAALLEKILNCRDFDKLTKRPDGLFRQLDKTSCSCKNLKKVHKHLLDVVVTIEQLKFVYKTCSAGPVYEAILKKAVTLCKTQKDCEDAALDILDITGISLQHLFSDPNAQTSKALLQIIKQFKRLKK